MSTIKFATFDTETTGLPVHRSASLDLQPRIIEFGGIITDGVEILDTLEFIANPKMRLESIITKITGLKDEDLEDKPMFEEYLPKILAYYEQADFVVAHNLSFDEAMLKYDLARIGLTLDDIHWPKGKICTVEQMHQKLGYRIKLKDWTARNFGHYEQKHRALDDVRILHNNCIKEGIYDSVR